MPEHPEPAISAIEIAGRKIGPGHPAFIVAEVAQAHEGSLAFAHAFIDSAARAGVDAVKFQTHIAAAESTLDEPFRTAMSGQDKTRYDYWRRMEFTAEQWDGLARHARERGLVFLSSPFSAEAVALLRRIGMPAWKVASGEIGSLDLIAEMVATGAPLILSTGMSPWHEIDNAVAFLRECEAPFALMQCTSLYPTPLEKVGLNAMGELRRRHRCPVGLSDHSGRTAPPLLALARGADILELHITLDRRLPGPDAEASLTEDEIAGIVAAREAFRTIDANPVDKDALAVELAELRRLFTRSAAPVRTLAAGTVLTADMLTAKKPGTGIPASEIPSLVGRRLARQVTPEHVLTDDDIAKD